MVIEGRQALVGATEFPYNRGLEEANARRAGVRPIARSAVQYMSVVAVLPTVRAALSQTDIGKVIAQGYPAAGRCAPDRRQGG